MSGSSQTVVPVSALPCWHTERLCHPFQAPGLSVLCVWLPQPRGPEWVGKSGTSDGLFSNNNAILCLKMSSVKHALSPYSPRPGGREVGGWCERGEAKAQKGTHPQPRILGHRKKNHMSWLVSMATRLQICPAVMSPMDRLEVDRCIILL